jgi:uncharacterized iron-regulated membrane protein
MSNAVPTARTTPPAGSPWRPLIARLHFFAGVLVAPFIAVACLTGLGFVLTPQLDRVVYGHELSTEPAGRAPVPLARQVAAAQAELPQLSVSSITLPPTPEDTTRVVFTDESLGEKARTVFVDPYTGDVRGQLVTWWGSTPLTTWLDQFHQSLQLGELGTLYTELAASWLWVLALGGLVLWWQHLRRTRSGHGLARRLLVAQGTGRNVRGTRSWHATTGVWTAVGLLFLSATGLTWSTYAGERFTSALDALDARTPQVDAALPAASSPAGFADLDRIVAVARDAGVQHAVTLTPPAEAGTGWVVAEQDNTWPVHYDQVVVDPSGPAVGSALRWSDWPLLAQLSKLGIQAHMGYLFGWFNQLLLIALATGLLCAIVWGYRMWWLRRPRGSAFAVGRPPARGGWRAVPRWQLVTVAVLVVALGVALPVLGVSLLAFLLLEALLARLRPRRRADVGPGTSTDPEPGREDLVSA